MDDYGLQSLSLKVDEVLESRVSAPESAPADLDYYRPMMDMLLPSPGLDLRVLSRRSV